MLYYIYLAQYFEKLRFRVSQNCSKLIMHMLQAALLSPLSQQLLYALLYIYTSIE